MTEHTVELSALQDWLLTARLDFASSHGKVSKRLSIMHPGTLVVTVGDKEVYRGSQPYQAVEAYNNALQTL